MICFIRNSMLDVSICICDWMEQSICIQLQLVAYDVFIGSMLKDAYMLVSYATQEGGTHVCGCSWVMTFYGYMLRYVCMLVLRCYMFPCLDVHICLGYATPEGGTHVYMCNRAMMYICTRLWLKWVRMCMFPRVSLERAHIRSANILHSKVFITTMFTLSATNRF
jgi:hypothetical protein